MQQSCQQGPTQHGIGNAGDELQKDQKPKTASLPVSKPWRYNKNEDHSNKATTGTACHRWVKWMAVKAWNGRA
jgi:hypothetical protein